MLQVVFYFKFAGCFFHVSVNVEEKHFDVVLFDKHFDDLKVRLQLGCMILVLIAAIHLKLLRIICFLCLDVLYKLCEPNLFRIR